MTVHGSAVSSVRAASSRRWCVQKGRKAWPSAGTGARSHDMAVVRPRRSGGMVLDWVRVDGIRTGRRSAHTCAVPGSPGPRHARDARAWGTGILGPRCRRDGGEKGGGVTEGRKATAFDSGEGSYRKAEQGLAATTKGRLVGSRGSPGRRTADAAWRGPTVRVEGDGVGAVVSRCRGDAVQSSVMRFPQCRRSDAHVVDGC